MIAYLFPGQGSQYIGMGKEFAESFSLAKDYLERADDLLNINLSKTMLEGPEERLRQTDFTQPAIFVHSVIVLECSELPPANALAGHSLGEYTALYSAKVMTFEETLQLVHLRGTLMAEAGRRSEGTMAAIIGMDAKRVVEMCREIESEMNTVIRPANFNSPGQIVVSGSKLGVSEAIRRAKAEGVRIAKELPVSGAFHSPLMQYASDGLKEALQSASLHKPEIPVFSNVTAEPEETVEDIRNLLVDQLTAPVRWDDTLRNMYDLGVREFIELGPGKVLQGLVSRTLQNVKVSGIDKPMAEQRV